MSSHDVPPVSEFPGHFGTVARDLSELKRMRDASTSDSVAERLFRAVWTELQAGADARDVCLGSTARALIATRLAGIDDAMLAQMEVGPSARRAVLGRGFADATASLAAATIEMLREAIDVATQPSRQVPSPSPPPFVGALIRQPRAGATSPGKPRLALEPAESHGDHCMIVAALGALIALETGADAARVFLAGLAHHLHNALLPDTGFAGEVMLGDSLAPLMQRLTARALATLEPALRTRIEDALPLITDADTPEGRAFHAADVIDRVLQAQHHARAAAFTLDQALGDLDLVHAGPIRAFHMSILSALELA